MNREPQPNPAQPTMGLGYVSGARDRYREAKVAPPAWWDTARAGARHVDELPHVAGGLAIRFEDHVDGGDREELSWARACTWVS
jgi:hypothetical protein